MKILHKFIIYFRLNWNDVSILVYGLDVVLGQRLSTLRVCAHPHRTSAQVFCSLYVQWTHTHIWRVFRLRLGGVLFAALILCVSAAINLLVTVQNHYPPAPLLTSKLQMFYNFFITSCIYGNVFVFQFGCPAKLLGGSLREGGCVL